VKKQRRILSHLFVLVLASLASQAAFAAIIHVGADGGCDAGTLEAAVTQAAATPEADEIRLNYGEGTLYDDTALVLTDFGSGAKGALSFVGGFGGCSDTTPSPTPVEIRGTPTSPVITVNTAGASSVVTLRNVELRNSGTHGLVISGNSTVTMDNADSVNNSGSGVRITGSLAWLDLINASRITNNTTSGYGGGIYCQGATVNIIAGIVNDNSASSGGGGGIYASNCALEVRKAGFISGNVAIDGGGIYADQGASITITGAADGRPAINVNTATDDGGAIYAKNPGTSVVVTNGRFDGNEAVSRGGAIFTSEGVLLIMSADESRCRLPTAAPSVPTRCSTMLNNTMSAGGQGAAIYAASGSTSYLAHTYLHSNEGESLVYVTDTGTEVYLEGLAMWNNAVEFLQDVGNSAFLSSAFVSGAHNRYDASGTPTDADVLQLGSATAEIHSSVYQGGSFLGTSGLSGRCLLASISTPLVAGVDHFTLNSDPGFIDAVGGNLRLTSDSPAVDYCDDSAYSAIWDDIDMQQRGIDEATNPDGDPGVTGGLFDLGFDELVDSIFGDRFEQL
jgi:predicted outer membrane repeat protein